MRQKEEAQEEKRKPSHRVKRDTSFANRERILQAKAGKRQANSPKKPSGHWKSKKHRPNDEDDLSQPWLCDETDPFTAWIQNFEVPKRTFMPVNVKTYDGTGDPDDHLKIFQATEKIERELLTTKDVHKGSCGNSSHQAEGWRVDGSFHEKIQSRKYACQRSTRVHENIEIHARNHQPGSNKKVERQHTKVHG
ncbi:hypothetical protein Tco_0751475 [Tanacetum coccineum]|uniref:Reverse transcriptase domain-containing protein n=1 Tax=Tanacetum coccineum TaxID=301880 RepID=A0ABQ4Z459_9ASTR